MGNSQVTAAGWLLRWLVQGQHTGLLQTAGQTGGSAAVDAVTGSATEGSAVKTVDVVDIAGVDTVAVVVDIVVAVTPVAVVSAAETSAVVNTLVGLTFLVAEDYTASSLSSSHYSAHSSGHCLWRLWLKHQQC